MSMYEFSQAFEEDVYRMFQDGLNKGRMLITKKYYGRTVHNILICSIPFIISYPFSFS